MRLKPRIWLLISLLVLAAAAWMWQRGGLSIAGRQERDLTKGGKGVVATVAGTTGKAGGKDRIGGGHSPPLQRLSNTSESLAQLARNEHGILLRSALIDTAKPVKLNIPEHLRS